MATGARTTARAAGGRGGRVVGAWKGLAPEHLLEGRDVPSLTDYRAVLAEALVGHLGVHDLASVFPGFSGAGLGLLRT